MRKTKSFISTLALGSLIGLLFAPKKGSETRMELKEMFDDLMGKLDDVDFNGVKDDFKNKLDELKDELEDLDKEKAIDLAKSKAKTLEKKANELVDYAIEKGTPVLERSAITVRDKTVSTLKDIVARLESKKGE